MASRANRTTMVKGIKIAFCTALVSLLGGCAVFDNDFSCKKIGGISGCVSMDQVYKDTQTGKISANRAPYSLNGRQYNGADGDNQTSGGVAPKAIGTGSGYTAFIPNAGQPVRYGDAIQKIWVFPYEDSDGNYHETSIVYTVLNQSHWIDQPVKAIQDLGE